MLLAPEAQEDGDLSLAGARGRRPVAQGAAIVRLPQHSRRGLVKALLAAGLTVAALAVAVALRGESAFARLVSGGQVELAADDCHTAVRGERCHADITWAMKDRNVHPAWYEGLSKESTVKDFQAFMHGQIMNGGVRRCPKPCGLRAKPSKPTHAGAKTRDKEHETDCHTAVPGDPCYNHVVYTQREAVHYPKWYPGLDENSSFARVQHYLQQEGVCPEPCGLLDDKTSKNASNKTSDCHTALPGETCFDDVLFAKHTFIHQHPEWYPGLTNFSSNEEFQALLHGGKSTDKAAEEKKCPKPCNRDAVEKVRIRARCRTAKRHDPCWESVVWGATKGIYLHPEWYKGLTPQSSFEDFQRRLHKGPKSRCPHQPCPCHTAVKGDACWRSVHWVRSTGLRVHPQAFEGLTNASSFQDVQAHLHLQRTTPCLRPCVPVPW